VTAHDGFTLYDLVSHNDKHNEVNGEDNRDGENHNRSWNCGEEGPTENPEILALRYKQRLNFLATLFLSQGIPMLLGGDEMGRTQQGNNNAYCQDNEISWFDWGRREEDLLEFTSRLIRFQHDHPVFRKKGWFLGRPIHGSGVDDIAWFTPGGYEMAEEHWGEGLSKSMAVFLNGEGIRHRNPCGEKVVDDCFLVLFNAHYEAIHFVLPGAKWGKAWKKLIDTAKGGFIEDEKTYPGRKKVPVENRSLVLLMRTQ
jgi:glycogen operon protein